MCTRWHDASRRGRRQAAALAESLEEWLTNWPPPADPVWSPSPALHMPPVARAPDMQSVEIMLRSFRVMGNLLVHADPSQRAELEHQLRTLESWRAHLSLSEGSARRDWMRKRYSALEIVCCLRANFMIRGSLEDAMQELAPLFGIKRSELRRKIFVPKWHSVKMYALAFDAALCLSRRREFEQLPACVRWSMCDSSPQCGYDWLWISYTEAPEHCLPDVLKAAWYIESNLIHYDIALGFRSDDLAVQRQTVHEIMSLRASEEYEAAYDLLATHITQHVCIPVGLAGGHSGVADKVSAVLHAFTMDLPPRTASLDSFLGSFACSTTDMGTEMAIADFEVECSTSLLPGWSVWQAGGNVTLDIDMGEDAALAAPPPPPAARRRRRWLRRGAEGRGEGQQGKASVRLLASVRAAHRLHRRAVAPLRIAGGGGGGGRNRRRRREEGEGGGKEGEEEGEEEEEEEGGGGGGGGRRRRRRRRRRLAATPRL